MIVREVYVKVVDSRQRLVSRQSITTEGNKVSQELATLQLASELDYDKYLETIKQQLLDVITDKQIDVAKLYSNGGLYFVIGPKPVMDECTSEADTR